MGRDRIFKITICDLKKRGTYKELLADKEEVAKRRGPLGFIPLKQPETKYKSKK
jgi:hypothetical protein